MLSLLVYKVKDVYYVVLLGGTEGFQTKEDVFPIGTEEEVFTIVHTPGTPFLEVVRQLVAKCDQQGITELRAVEAIFSAGKDRVARDRGANN